MIDIFSFFFSFFFCITFMNFLFICMAILVMHLEWGECRAQHIKNFHLPNFHLHNFQNITFFNTNRVWFKIIFFQKPLAQLTVLLALGCQTLGYVEPWHVSLNYFLIDLICSLQKQCYRVTTGRLLSLLDKIVALSLMVAKDQLMACQGRGRGH